jgi:uncharacterized membrane protein
MSNSAVIDAASAAPAVGVSATPARRIDSIDILRGVVMVIMAIDHSRDYFTNVRFDPLALKYTWTALFLTRWITHVCAPVFVFLAGTGSYLSMARGKSKAEISRFLASRGLWLVLLEYFLIDSAWLFNLDMRNSAAGVIWAIGWSMIALAILVWLPVPVIGAFGLLMIALHNAFDPIVPAQLGEGAWLWTILHEGGGVPFRYGFLWVNYPLVPWIGVMAVGYAFGALVRRTEQPLRARLFARAGLIVTVAFLVLRAINVYGDPRPWAPKQSTLFTIFSFVNTHKYPPSLAYLLMTLGPALLLLALIERARRRGRADLLDPLLVFGRVPLFFYLLHLPLLHAMAVGLQMFRGGDTSWMFGTPPAPSVFTPPADYGYGLPVVYLIWAIVVVLLYFPCRWFADVKARRREAWLSYL